VDGAGLRARGGLPLLRLLGRWKDAHRADAPRLSAPERVGRVVGIRLLDEIPGTEWSAYAVDLMTGHILFERDSGQALRTASMGKARWLIGRARRLAAGVLDAAERLARTPDDAGADSGVWQHLATDVLAVSDAAAFIGVVSDNLATNVRLTR